MIRRVKQRYLALQIESGDTLEKDDIRNAILSAVIQLFGEYGASQAGLFLVEYDEIKKQAVLRCSLKALMMVRASLASITKLKNKHATFHVIRISGTLRGLSKKRPSLIIND